MTLIELKNYVNNLPEEFNHFDVFDGKFKQDENGDMFRIDDPIVMIVVDKTNECILYLTEDIVGN